jgi:hypothetical protein
MDTNQSQNAELIITNDMINSMRSTKPWTRLVAILGFIVVGLCALIGILMVFGGRLISHGDGMSSVLAGIMYIIMSALYFVPSLYLLRYSSAVDKFVINLMASDMELALAYQRSFWKYVGIFSIVMIIISIIGIVAAIAIPMLVRMKIQ